MNIGRYRLAARAPASISALFLLCLFAFQGSVASSYARRSTLNAAPILLITSTGNNFTQYGGSGNTGPHPVTLWKSDGTVLATATPTQETQGGWQDVQFSTPVSINANTVYVASYHAPKGDYAWDANDFANTYDNAPLHVPSSAASGGNGVYSVGQNQSPVPAWFPTSNSGGTNYWVDVDFVPNQ
jgi:hypothetical protein